MQRRRNETIGKLLAADSGSIGLSWTRIFPLLDCCAGLQFRCFGVSLSVCARVSLGELTLKHKLENRKPWLIPRLSVFHDPPRARHVRDNSSPDRRPRETSRPAQRNVAARTFEANPRASLASLFRTSICLTPMPSVVIARGI